MHRMDYLDTSQWPDQSGQAIDRVMYTVAVLKGTPPAVATEQLGHSRNYPLRLAEHLETYGTFSEAPHHKERTKFTDEVMRAALQHLVDNAESALTTTELVCDMQQAGMLTAPTDNHNFIVRLREYAAEQDLTLLVGDTSTTFRITEDTADDRVKVAGELLELASTDAQLQQWIFVDETHFEESPHPKGRSPTMVHNAFARPFQGSQGSGCEH